MTGDNTLRIYPNPFSSALKYELSAIEGNKRVAIEILDMFGRTIARYDKYTHRGEIDFPDVSTGTYVVKITTNKEVLTKFVIKQ